MKKSDRFHAMGGLALVALLSLPHGFSQSHAAEAIPDYSKVDRDKVPVAFRWRIEDIYPSVEAWKTDLAQALEDLEALTSLFSGWSSTPQRMAEFLDGQAALSARSRKLASYAVLCGQVHLSSPLYPDLESQVQRLEIEMATRFSSVDVDILQFGEAKLAEYRASEPRLRTHDAHLRMILLGKDHVLSDETKKVLSQASLFADGARQAAYTLNERELPMVDAMLPDGSKVAAGGGAWERLSRSGNAGERRAVSEARAVSYQRLENTFAAMLDASVKREVFDAKLRRFPDAISAQMFEYEIDPAVHKHLVETLKQNLAPYHRYLNVRKRILGLQEYHAYDRFLQTFPEVPLRFTFEETRRLIQESCAPLGPEYSELVRRAFEERWMDVYSHKDKAGLGSASPVAGVHPYILLNFHGTFFDFDTVGHELGHAIQFHLADTAQPFAASDPSWFTTEIPSQVQEFLLIHHLIQLTSDDRTRLAILCEFLDRLELVLIDQARQAEFKQAMFEQVENGGTLTPAWVNAKNLELLRRYRGHAQGITVVDDFAKSSWDHRVIFGATSLRGFCVGFNAAAALALSQQILDGGEPEAQRYVAFLKAGCSKPAMQLLKEAGVDFSTAQPFEAAMKSFDRLVDEMEDTLARAEAKSMPAR